MVKQYTVFNKKTGVICKIGGCPEEEFWDMPLDDNHSVISGIYFPSTWYINVEKIPYQPVQKKQMIVIVEGDVIRNVPPGSIFIVKELGRLRSEIQEDITLEVENAGKYHIKIKHDHYLDTEVEVEVK